MPLSPSGHLLLRRAHSLTGVIPLGLFLVQHLLVNAIAIAGPDAFNRAAATLDRIPYMGWIQAIAIGVPLLFHLMLGIVIAGLDETAPWPRDYANPWRRRFQQLTGVFLAFFVIYHLWGVRFSPELLAGNRDRFAFMARHLHHPGVLTFYGIGVVVACLHLGNGIGGFFAHWWPRLPDLERRARIAAAAAMALALIGLNALLAFRFPVARWLERG